MKTAIIGLPMVGKTSLFTILTGVHESTRVGLMEARVGMTKVPDARLDALAKIFEPPKITYATVEYLDFPAISKEALRDPSYLASMRVADALASLPRPDYGARPGAERYDRRFAARRCGRHARRTLQPSRLRPQRLSR